ncbi:hypothetical protein DFS34DRAFT_678235 [Phlyctochytrium arcticum]|nr:hypothetical protein DFS34DRAFT_678235 [Phlyctochytrium arcticum]
MPGTIIFSISLPTMRTNDSSYWTMGRVPKQQVENPKGGQQWPESKRRRFVPDSAMMNDNVALAAESTDLNPLAPEFFPEVEMGRPAQLGKTRKEPRKCLNPNAIPFVSQSLEPEPVMIFASQGLAAAAESHRGLNPLADEFFPAADHPQLYIPTLPTLPIYCYGPWPNIALYIIPVYSPQFF